MTVVPGFAKTLFMMMLGCRPPGRVIEQHDIFFAIADNVRELTGEIKAFWPEVKNHIHVDAWRRVTRVDGFSVGVVDRQQDLLSAHMPLLQSSLLTGLPTLAHKLFFVNLGGYKPNEFDEFHYKLLIVASDKVTAIRKAKQTMFYRQTGFKGAAAHIDEKYGVDVDDIFEINDLLSTTIKSRYKLVLEQAADQVADEIHLGYMPLHRLSDLR